MYLKSLTLKGFKSFASATTLHFEKGITAVVGPNGSGKSNVVDAIAWVLGEQGAKALRGGKMEDVIFAGTADRPPLGRAEVTLTIDNSDGALPIDFSEVSITRRMFRDGAGEYEINGRTCRLLDIQELLSDSGIGREMHVIVGQGQLDAVLQARPEDRRAFIEEAAGVLKHRKRKEKALRKLDAMQANLTRLNDLTGELRRQLKPLGRQAEVARRAAGVQADLRDSRLRLLADDYVVLTTRIAAESADEAAALEHRTAVQRALAEASEQAEAASESAAGATPRLAAAQETWFALSALAERFRGTVSLADERLRNLTAPVDAPRPGRDPDELDAAAEAAEEAQAEKDEAVAGARTELDEAVAQRTESENALKGAENQLLSATRAIADRREGLARLSGQVDAARSRQAAGGDEVARLATSVADARDRAAAAQARFTELQDSVGDLDSSEVGLDEDHESAEEATEAARQRVGDLTDALREARSEQTGLRARVEALSLGLDRRDGAGALLAAGSELAGVLGSVAAVLEVDPGFEGAVAAALGPAADAVAVSGVADAAAALALLQEGNAGRAGLLIGGPGHEDLSGWPTLPSDAVWVLPHVRLPALLRAAVGAALDRVAVVADLPAAVALVTQLPQVRAVTREGDLLGSGWAFGGSAGKQSVIEIQAAVDEADSSLARVTDAIAELEAALSGARSEAETRARQSQATLSALHESDARLSAVSEQLGRLGEAVRSATAEAERLERQRQAAETSSEQTRLAVADLEARLYAAESEDAPEEVDTEVRDSLMDLTAGARQVEVEARLALRTAEERARAGAGVAEGLRRSARQEREARSRAQAAVARRAAAAEVATRVAEVGRRALSVLEVSLAVATSAREQAAADRERADAAMSRARSTARELQTQWDALTDAVHKDEVQRAQQMLRVEQLVDRAANEFGLGPDDLVTEFGPEMPIPPTALETGEYEAAKERGEEVTAPAPMAFDRDTQERRAKRAERDLNLLGKVNPLALEEFAALEERHSFLSTQLEDLKSTRKDLLTVVGEVDEKILEVFTAAYHDVAREFVAVFAELFPGGEGELILTDPSDMLTTGIEVHARPPGKKVKRLSLLSGGERSLTAVALLVSIFRARPSPFYIMDEVEAALDEVNLTRLVGLLTLLRDSSQLIIITHQKFTMESADALYGVSMRGDGITQVISQRIRNAETPVVVDAPGAVDSAGSAGAVGVAEDVEVAEPSLS
ncbi:chromosome segregation protein SMC [Nakamurella sp. PAMC28650]|uniref:chromosome segregation protein SMC n=1 Tax=Nakamurella sp. PAMC28650 TaxID=2762325 RepID=UPI00164D9EF7|nr:chromosome segregation protein SMC [Nakamurella sp. PAMC28650]QNK80446.1 chromosome segregation protein SMC [Nakamurella sp. PAMC28650]